MSEPEDSGNGQIRTAWPVQNYVLGAILVVLFILACRLIAPFFTMLLWSVLLYIIFTPLHQRMIRAIKVPSPFKRILERLMAGAFSLLTVILFIIPLGFLASQFIRQILELTRVTRDYLIHHPDFFSRSFNYAADLIRDLSGGSLIINPNDIQRRVVLFLSSGLQNLLHYSSIIAKNISSFLLHVFFMTFTLYFLYLDGAYLSQLALRVIPIRKEYLATLVGKFKDITRSLFFGYFVISFFQSVVAYIIFALFHIRGAMVFAALVFVVSFIPMIGVSLIWFPLGLWLMANASIWEGVLFWAVSWFLISALDMFLRPQFLKDRLKCHPLVIFLSLLGGIAVLGFNGLILGPIVVILFLTVLDMFLSEHRLDEDL